MTVINAKKIQTGDYQTYIHEGGDPSHEAIIFLHGSGPGVSAQTNWREILPNFAQRFHVIAPDLFGFGQTDHPEEPPQNGAAWMRARINQIIVLMDSLNIEKTHLVGNSLGGVISLHLLMHAPMRFDRVVLMGAGGGAYQPTMELTKLMNFHRDPDPAAMENLLRWFVYDESILEDKLQSIVQERLEVFNRPEVRKSYEANFTNANVADIIVPPSALKRMNHPILIIHGQEDRFVPLDSSLDMMKHLPDAQLHIIKRCGHWAQIEQKERFVKLASDFFSGAL